ncbi:MAG TPA: hypothetical protein VH253_07275 [Phycisphaerae bacterium]|nr:hypothetical protein [Phycisphaerae bacterium]
MSPPIPDIELLCPACSYDLRAALLHPGPLRCPECGAHWPRTIASSRIPWVHRRRSRRLYTYLGTLWMLLRRPQLLGRELRNRVAKRDALLFANISLSIALAIGLFLSGALFTFFLTTGAINALPSIQSRTPWIAYPLAASMDWRVFFFADFLWLWTSLHTLAWLYRWIIGWFIDPPLLRRRLQRLACYALALAPLEVSLLGVAAACSIVAASGIAAAFSQVLSLASLLLVLAAYALLAAPSLGLTLATGGNRALRSLAITALFPLLSAGLILLLAYLAFWATGFIAMAVWSLLPH